MTLNTEKATMKPFFNWKPTKNTYIKWWEKIILRFIEPKYGYDYGYGKDKSVVVVVKKMFGKTYIIETEELRERKE